MFAPNAWEAYCSALSSNIHCIGLLLVPDTASPPACMHACFKWPFSS
jgi:hypothetical protein